MAAEKLHDYSAFEEAVEPPVGVLAKLSALALDQLRAEGRVARLVEELRVANETLRQIAENQIPELMENAGVTSYTTSGGLEISIKEAIRGSIPKSNEEEAFAWLTDNNHGNLIKRQFIIDFGKDEEGWAKKFAADLKRRKKQLNTVVKRTVHAQTLQAFIRAELCEGTAIPMDVFGVYKQKFSSVKTKST